MKASLSMEPYYYARILNRKAGFLPSDFRNMRVVTDLWICECRVPTVPAAILALVNLTSLHIEACTGLRTLPDGLETLRLQRLDIRCCQDFAMLPTCVARIKTLRVLEIAGCKTFTSLPSSIGDLTELRHLTVTSLSDQIASSFTGIPDSIGRLQQLESMSFSFCPALQRLPRTLLSLSSLRELNLNGCPALLLETWMVYIRERVDLIVGPSVDMEQYRRVVMPKLAGCRLLTLLVAMRRRRQRSVPSEIWEHVYVYFLGGL